MRCFSNRFDSLARRFVKGKSAKVVPLNEQDSEFLTTPEPGFDVSLVITNDYGRIPLSNEQAGEAILRA
jgi:hypothetical protein